MLNFDVPDLYVKDYNNDFSKRQGSLQEALEAAEKECGKDSPMKKTLTKSVPAKKCRSITKNYRGKESMFKVPDSPPRRTNLGTLLKDNKTRAGKWTKYTLSDVRDDDMSDSTNARTAFSFMKELENRKRGPDEVPVSLETFKPVFKKPLVPKERKVLGSVATEGDSKHENQCGVKLSFFGTEDE